MSNDDISTAIVPGSLEGRSSEPQVVVDDQPFLADGDRYEMLGTIAKGGMGEVLLAKDTRIARRVAIKVLSPELRNQHDFKSRFLLEARLQGQLEHPSIVPVHDLGETPDGQLFFSMKHVRGITLRDAIQAARGEHTGKLSRRRLLTAFSNVCLAVEFAHSRGVLHRDLKPSNIMLGDFGEVYILDWGIAKLVDQQETPVTEELELPGIPAATRVGAVLGTPKYMAPERRLSGAADRSTDIYALGMILRELLEADSVRLAPPELTAVADKATAEDPAKRFATARDLYNEIESYLDGDRDLRLRRTKAEQHAQTAERALARADANARADAGREIGRALGLDPANERAMQTMMRLLTDIPTEMPEGAQHEMERVWRARRARTLRMATLITAAMLLYVPFVVAMGVRNWWLFGAWLGLAVGAAGAQWIASRTERTLPFLVAIAFAVGELAILTTSMGLNGLVPASFGVVMFAWRLTVKRTFHGVALLVAVTLAMTMPFVLPALGVMSSTYVVGNDTLVILPHMNHFPAMAAPIAMFMATLGAVAAAGLFGRVYSVEIQRVEERMTFLVWQLQQLLSQEKMVGVAL